MIAQKKKKLSITEQIRIVIKVLPEWFTTTDVSDNMVCTLNTARNAVYRMHELGELERSEGVDKIGRFGRGYRFRATANIGNPIKHGVVPPVYPEGCNIFQEILRKGHDEDFEPSPAKFSTGELPGSQGKIEVLRRRVELGESLWHPDDLVHGTQLGKIPNGWWKELRK